MSAESKMKPLTRRSCLRRAAALSLVSIMPLPARATPQTMQIAMESAFGDRPITPGRVNLDLPALAEDGNSVLLGVSVDSPMTKTDYVRFVQLFSPENPLPDVARFEFFPGSGMAEVKTRIRLSADQTIVAVAGLSDDSLWSALAQIRVVEGACLDGLI
ncbi:MAG: thiosulfate oxidation carrier protein SoxY [Pseudomonadota bacterium]